MNNAYFIAFTPYHVKVSNFLAKEKYKNKVNSIILLDIGHTKSETLRSYVVDGNFKNIYHINLRFRTIDLLINPLNIYNYRKNINIELIKLQKIIINNEKKDIICFSDDTVYLQDLFRKVKKEELDSNIILVEEGLAIYLEHNKKSIKDKIRYNIERYIYNIYDIPECIHGQSRYVDKIYAREPDLIKSDKIKIKMEKIDFRKIVFQNIKETNIDMNDSVLFCPTKITYNKKKMIKIYEKILKYYYERKKYVYVKLHPAEIYVDEIKSIIKKYNKYVSLLENSYYTSEDYIVNNNINVVISDYSSTLINAHYLRENIEIITYRNLILKHCGQKNKFNITIFEKMISDNIIREFNE